VADLLYAWPPAATVRSRVPKEKLYEHGTVSTAVREQFVSEVQRITWAYKLAESSINLPGSSAVPEIQVFEIEAKHDDVPPAVLGVIDRAIPFPIIFEVVRAAGAGNDGGRRVRMAAAHKQIGPGVPTVSPYYSTGWQPTDALRRPLPTAITLPALYTGLLAPLMPIVTRPGEDVSAVAARLHEVRMLEREITALERKLRIELQLNRKIELRRTLMTKQAQLEQQR